MLLSLVAGDEHAVFCIPSLVLEHVYLTTRLEGKRYQCVRGWVFVSLYYCLSSTPKYAECQWFPTSFSSLMVVGVMGRVNLSDILLDVQKTK